MPRACINKKQYMAEDFPAWVRKEMRKKKIRQNDMAREFGQSQQYVSNRITGNIPFTYPELLIVFQVLETEPEDVLRWMMVRGGAV